MLQVELRRLIDRFVKDYGDFGLEKLDGEEVGYERMTESLQSMPFLAGRKLVVLRSPSAQKAFTEQFEQLLPSIPEETDVIVVEPKLDKRTAYFKALKRLTEFSEFHELDERSLMSWLMSEATARGGKLSSGDARYLLSRLGPNQQLLSNELDKLLSYQPQISKESIDLLTEPLPQSSIFDLLDTAFRGQRGQALQLYREQRALKVEPQQILAMLAWQLHVLAIIKTAGERNVDDIARSAKLNPFVVRKSQALARKIRFEELRSLVRRSTELDARLKSSAIDADEALQNLLLELGN